MAVSRDLVRINSFFRSFIVESHLASYFDNGNLKTLKDDITDDELYKAVHEFFKKYVANNMFLSVQSKRSLDELQDLVLDKFANLKSGEIVSRRSQAVDKIFKPNFYNKIHYIKPKKDTKALYLSWYINSVVAHYKCQPLKYLKTVFKNQGEGGISTYLREKKLALSVSLEVDTPAFESNSMFALVKISVKLTDLGLDHLSKVLEAIFSYLLMLKETPAQEHLRLYNDCKEKAEMDFKFHKESEASENVVKASMKYFDDVDVIQGDGLYQESNEDIIFDIISAMNQRKFNVIIATNEHDKFDKKEKYFGTEYDELDFPEKFQQLWDERRSNPDFFLEKPNPYKATNFEIFESEEESFVRAFPETQNFLIFFWKF